MTLYRTTQLCEFITNGNNSNISQKLCKLNVNLIKSLEDGSFHAERALYAYRQLVDDSLASYERLGKDTEFTAFDLWAVARRLINSVVKLNTPPISA